MGSEGVATFEFLEKVHKEREKRVVEVLVNIYIFDKPT